MAVCDFNFCDSGPKVGQYCETDADCDDSPAANSDGNLTASASVSEPVALSSSADSAGEAVDLFDFTLSDGGGGDGLALEITQIVLQTSGSADFSKVVWRLNGNDVSNASGVYSAGANTLTFSGLNISVADGGSEVYTLSGYFSDSSGLTEGQTLVLSVDGDTHLSVGSGGTQMGSTSAVANGAGTEVEISATQLVWVTQPAGVTSGSAMTTQPVVRAQDDAGNLDNDFSEIVSLSTSAPGSLSNNSVAAVSGTATFTALSYTATADQQTVVLSANDQDDVGSNLPSADANSVTADVVATQLVFDVQPAPLLVNSGEAVSLTTVPVVSARDANNLVDTGYSTAITLSEVNGAGTAQLSATGDSDGDAATVSIAPASGVATFTGMTLNYSASGATETFNLQASSGGLATVTSSQLTGLVADTDGTLTAAAGVSEPQPLNFSVDTSGEAIDLFDFTISDGGSADGLPLLVSQLNINVSGTSTDAERAAVTWRLSGPDVSEQSGSYNPATDTISFSGLSISVADGASETYVIDGFLTSISINHNASVILSVDGDADLTVGESGSQMASTTPVTNGSGTLLVDDIAPVVSSVSVPGNATYGIGTNLDFVVNVDSTLNVIGSPRLVLTLGTETRYADYLSGDASSIITFRYVVQAGDLDGDGIALGTSLDVNGGSLKDAAGNDLNITLNSVGSLSAVLVDGVVPTLNEVTAVTTPTPDSTPTAVVSGSEAGTLTVGGSCGSGEEGAVTSGNITITLSQPDNATPLSDGSYADCSVTLTDSAGNASSALTLSEFTVDTTAPTGHSVAFLQDPVNGSNQLQIGFQFAGAESGADFNYSISSDAGGTDITGNGSLSTSSDRVELIDVSGLPDGTLTLAVVVSDQAGNTASAVSDTADKDTVASLASVSIDADINASNQGGFAFTLSGAESGTLSYQISSSGGGTPLMASGLNVAAANAQFGSIDVSSLADGTLTLSVELTDAAGNLVGPVTDTANKDALGPQVTSVSLSSGTLKAGDSIEVRAALDDVILLSGTNSVARLTLGSVSRTAELVSGHNSNELVFSYQVQSGDNDDDGVTVTAIDTQGDTAEDGNGNPAQLSFSAVTETGLMVDTLAPAAPSAAQSAQTLNADTLTLSQQGYSENGVQILLLTDANGDGIADSDAALATATVVAGDWSLEATLSQDGENHFVLRAQDEVGNYSDAAIGSFLEDSTVPVSPVLVSPVEDTYQITTALTLSGSHSEDGVRVLLLADADNNGVADNETALETATVSGGSWQFALTLADNSATHLVAVAEDDAGNRSAPVALPTLVHDSIAPVAQMEAQLTNDNTPSLTGTLVEAGGMESMSIRLLHSDGGVYGPFTPNTLSDSAWSLAATADNLEDGSYNVELTLEDKAGNTKVESLDAQLVVDTQAPEQYGVTIEQQRIHAYNQGAMSFLLEGGSAGEQYAYSIEDGQGGTVSASGALAQTDQVFADIDVSALSQGTLTLTFILTDEAGNQGEGATDEVLKQYNLAPQLSGTPAVSVEEDSAYSFSPGLSDDDSFDSHSFSISGLPAWASFDVASGRLWGTPTNEHVGSHGGITITVADAAGASASIGPFTITVVNSNDAPMVAGLTLTTEEDTALTLNLPQVDQEGDSLSYRLDAEPSEGRLSENGGSWHYTPNQDFNGQDSLQLVASDGELESDAFTVTIEVTPVNDTPVAVDDTFAVAANEQGRYPLLVLENDSDVDGDPLTLVSAQSSLGQVTIETQLLTLDLEPGFGGEVVLSYLVADEEGETANATVALSVGDGELEGLPELTPPEPVEVNADALFTRVDLGVAKAVDASGEPLPVSLVQGEPLLRPGGHQVYWQTQDGQGNSATASQLVKVHPMVNLHKDQSAAEGREVTIALSLNGDAVTYPLELPFTLSGTAEQGVDYQLETDRFVVTSGRYAEVTLTILADEQSEQDETVELTLDSALNLGHKGRFILTISDGNLAPQLALSATQSSENRTLIAQDAGPVVIQASAEDPNPQDSLTLTWESGELVDQDSDPASFTLDPQSMAPGDYRLEVTVSDGELSTREGLTLQLVSSLAPLGEEDSDGDLLPDSHEGYGDSDNDGIPDYLDALEQCHLQPEELQVQQQYLFEGEEGVCLRTGILASEGQRRSVWVDKQDPLPEDEGYLAEGGTFDFIAEGLPEAGQSYRLVLPQRAPIPAGAIYRKYSPQLGWYQFVEQQGDAIHSAPGEPGYCPPPGAPQWQTGLREGAWCVQLTISDGGPNDADGRVDGNIHDPGGVAVSVNGNSSPSVVTQLATLQRDSLTRFDPLSKAQDPDGDALEMVWALADLGQVSVESDGALVYRPPVGYLGDDRIRFLISDGRGGSTQGSIELTLVANGAPVALADYLESDDLTEIVVDVLANDSDPDGDLLLLEWVEAQVGQASITDDNRLRYRPKPGYEGEDRVTYQVRDPLGATAQSQLVLTLNANEELKVSESSGGALGWGALMALLALMFRRGIWVAMLLPLAAQAQWRVHLQGGYSQGDSDSGAIRQSLEQAGVTLSQLSVDDTAVSWGVGLGYDLTPRWQVRMDYQDLGDYELNYVGTALDPDEALKAAAGSGPKSAQGVALGVHYHWPLGTHWGLALGGGGWYWEGESVSQSQRKRYRVDADGTDWFGEVGVSYRLQQQWQLSGGWQHFELDSDRIGNGFVRLEYRF
ncbi:Ig-like domain-containing protein [Ferrimonas sp. YFM]|uniref:Ig-like domain-containing protein n=1 Tax=Ferrimonas sp. YFM TaxID=3028878 RepID=UPI0025732A27|nr:Ig-like domain-containing protein [Ferrimonas sp. YFM]